MIFIGLKHVPSQMVKFQIPTLISFGLEKSYHLSNFLWPKLFEDDIAIIFDRFSSIKCLSNSKNLVNAKLLVVGKLLADGKLFSVSKHLVYAKHLASIQMLTDLTYLPDLTIDENTQLSIAIGNFYVKWAYIHWTYFSLLTQIYGLASSEEYYFAYDRWWIDVHVASNWLCNFVQNRYFSCSF